MEESEEKKRKEEEELCQNNFHRLPQYNQLFFFLQLIFPSELPSLLTFLPFLSVIELLS